MASVRVLALVLAYGLAALPALAAPMGPVLRASFKGWLGNSGLHVQTTRQSVLVTHVAKGSAASLAGIAGVSGGPPTARTAQVLRILAVNGRPVATLTTRELREAFREQRVTLVLGRRGPADLEEAREGPHVVELYPQPASRAFDMAARGQWLQALDVAKPDPAVRAAVVSRMLFEAQRLAGQGEPDRALKVLALVPRDEIGHDRALELARQYEKVSREARR
ncbi:MAG: hypothetical protein FJZ01_21230 [Candidatus Sericytochromatia bacterium]|nr:hypothetical protein [Candidatus Tanganyikabacteria bacterium]